MVVVILSGHAGWGGGGALKFVLVFLPSILDPRKLKRCQNEGWSLVSRQPNSEHTPPSFTNISLDYTHIVYTRAGFNSPSP